MASSSYLARVIYREHSDGAYTGAWNLLMASKSIPTPMGTPNTIETTTLEDNAQTFIPGIKSSDALNITGNLEKDVFDTLSGLENKELDFMFLYGTEGTGSVLKVARQGKVVVTPNDVGVDGVIEMTATITPSTSAEVITDDVTVSTTDGKAFTVATP